MGNKPREAENYYVDYDTLHSNRQRSETSGRRRIKNIIPFQIQTSNTQYIKLLKSLNFFFFFFFFFLRIMINQIFANGWHISLNYPLFQKSILSHSLNRKLSRILKFQHSSFSFNTFSFGYF